MKTKHQVFLSLLLLVSHQKSCEKPYIWCALFLQWKIEGFHYPRVPSGGFYPHWSHLKREKAWEQWIWAFPSFSASTVLAHQWTNLFWKSTSRDFKPSGFHSYNEKVLFNRCLEFPWLQLKLILFCPLPLMHWTKKKREPQPELAKLLSDLRYFVFKFPSESQV